MGGAVRSKQASAGLAALMVCALASGPVQAASFLENFWLPNDKFTGNIPVCNEPLALGTISMRFAETERMYWNANLNINSFSNVKEIAFRPWGEAFQPRRYCSATVVLSDQRKHAIYYSIVEDASFDGFTWGVSWCIEGMDPMLASAPDCKMARP